MPIHKHCEVIKAWAEGAEIQYRRYDDERWLDARHPRFNEEFEYRIKPRTVNREGWVRLYRWANGSVVADSMLFDTEENAKRRNLADCVAAVKIEWDEEE